jgi:hypothetical protein
MYLVQIIYSENQCNIASDKWKLGAKTKRKKETRIQT